LTLAQVLANC